MLSFHLTNFLPSNTHTISPSSPMHPHFKCFDEVHQNKHNYACLHRNLFILKEIYKEFGKSSKSRFSLWLCVSNLSSLQKWIKSLTFAEEHMQPHGESSHHRSAESVGRRLLLCQMVTVTHGQDNIHIKTKWCRRPRGFWGAKKGGTCNSNLRNRSYGEYYICCLGISGNTF